MGWRDDPVVQKKAAWESDPVVNDHTNDNDPQQTGAPASVRAAVGAMPDAATRLEAIRKIYPDAKPHGEDNFVYTDPKTKQLTLYNPEGLDRGDFASLLPELAEFAGGTAGAIGGGTAATAAGPVGTVAGAIGGAGAGATAAREAVQRAAMAHMGVTDDRSAGAQVKDAATTFALNAGGQAAGMAVGAGVRGLIRSGARGAGKVAQTATQQAISDLNRFGATPSVAQATQNAGIDSFESLTAKVPGGAGTIRQAAKKQSETVAANYATKLKNLNSNVAPDTLAAGKAATQGVEDFVRNFGDKADVLYSKLDSFIPTDTVIPVKNTERILAEIITPAKGAPNVSATLANPKLVQLQQALGKDASNGAVTYTVLKDLRSSIGRRLGSPSLTDDIPRAELKRVYGALSDDLRMAAQERGPQAVKAFDRAGQFYKAGMDRIDNMLKPIVQGKLPEQVFASLESAGRLGPTRLQALRQSVSPEQWRTVVASVADRMGKAAAGQQGEETANFSFQKFLTNWQKLEPKARDVLFSGPKMGGIRNDLDALARASERIRDSSKAFANPSGTAGASAGTTMAFASIGSLLTGNMAPLAIVIAGMSGAKGSAHLLTSPRFVNWLARATRIAPNGMGAHIGRLSAIAADSDADTRDAIKGYADALAAEQSFDTELSPQEEAQFQTWKQRYAPRDSGADYDLRGAFKAGLTPDPQSGHWPDTFKKPNHPTFSVESKYAKDAPDRAGRWQGETYIPAGQ